MTHHIGRDLLDAHYQDGLAGRPTHTDMDTIAYRMWLAGLCERLMRDKRVTASDIRRTVDCTRG